MRTAATRSTTCCSTAPSRTSTVTWRSAGTPRSCPTRCRRRTSPGGTSPRPCTRRSGRSRPPRGARSRPSRSRPGCSTGHAPDAGSSAAWARTRSPRSWPAEPAVPRHRSGRGLDSMRGSTHLRARERVRRHVHVPRAAAALARRGRPLSVPKGRALGTLVERVPRERGPSLPGRRLAPRVRDARMRSDLGPGGARQGGGADPRGAPRRGRGPAARGGHQRTGLPVQEQHGLGGQLVRVSRELPGGPAGRVRAHGRPPDPVLRDAADLVRRRQGPARPARRRLLHRAARRAHLGGRIVGDSNMSEFSSWMKVGVTDLVLRMLEANTVMRDLSLENPIRAIREISHDVTCRKKVRLANGRELTAIDVQEEYFERTSRFLERRGSDPQSKQLLEEWRDALDALTDGEPEQLMRKVDWVAKHALIERYRLKHDLPLSHPRVALLDLAYHDVNRSRGLYHLLERQQRVERAGTEKKFQRAMSEPPQTTRAKIG